MYFCADAEESTGVVTSKRYLIVCLFLLTVSAVEPVLTLADCSPVGTWEGTEYGPAAQMSATVELIISSDGHIVGTSYVDLRPDYEHTITTYTDEYLDTWAGDCSMTSHDQGNMSIEVLPGYWFDLTYDSLTEGTFAECDVATGTASGTSYAPEIGTVDEFSTWQLHRTSIPDKVANKYPIETAENVSLSPVLDWSWPPGTYGYGACTYDVYIGTNSQAVADASDPDTLPGRGNHSRTTYEPDRLIPGTTYYWRIDARNTNGVAKGDLRSFTTCGRALATHGKISCNLLEALAQHWLRNDCAEPGWCEETDLDCTGTIDFFDLDILGKYWMEDTDLIGHWEMNDNEANRTVLDSSMKGNHGAARQNTSQLSMPGMIDKALAFDGSSDYVKIGDSAFLPSGNNARSVSAWIKTYRSSGDNFIFTYGSMSWGNFFGFSAGSTYVGPGNTVCLLCWGIDWDTEYVVPLDQWIHLALTHDHTETRLYVNGSLQASTNSMIIDTRLDGDALIGKLANGDGPFQGLLDDVRVYQRVLRPEEVAALADPGIPNADAGPDQTVSDIDKNGSEQVTLDGSGSADPDGAIVNWQWSDDLGDPIGDGENTTAQLSTGSHTITLTVTDNRGNTDTDTVNVLVLPAATVEPPLGRLFGHWTMDDNANDNMVIDSSIEGNHAFAQKNTSALHTEGAIEGALTFDGSTDFVNILFPDDWRLPQDFALTLWARFDSLNSNWWEAALMGQDEGGGDRNKWIFSYDPAVETTLFHINWQGSPGVIIRGDSWTAQSGEWYSLGVSRIDDTFTFFKDGETNGSVEYSAVIPHVATPMRIGWAEGPRKFHGVIDDVRLYYPMVSDSLITGVTRTSFDNFISSICVLLINRKPGVVPEANREDTNP